MLENEKVGVKRFAVVDLEATSTKPKNRIMELAVLILEDNGQEIHLKDTYNTLINPEVEVPKNILDLTGITLQELSTAPKFFEIADDLELLTRDCIIVAHNVQFDMGLLQEEFETLGKEFLRKTQCTQKLSQEQYPELASYDLKGLCELLEIELIFNHRAMDDAVACAELFQKTYYPQRSQQNQTTGPSLTVLHKTHPGLDLKFLGQLTSTPGVVHFNREGKTVYIERFENLKVQVPRYLMRFSEIYETDVDYLQVLPYKDSLLAMRKKEERIQKIKPELNIEERKNSWGVFLKENPFSLRAFPLFKGKGDLLFIADNKDDAVYWIRLQLEDVEKQEFAYIDQQDLKLMARLKKEREKQIRAKVKPFASYPHDYFVVMGPGRDDDELSCHFFSGGKLAGHTYLSGQQMLGVDIAPRNLKPCRENEILKHYFLREFQDWKNRKSRDHSIKVLKSNKKSSSYFDPDQEVDGNTMDIAPDGQRIQGDSPKKQAKKNNHTGSKKKKFFNNKKKKPFKKKGPMRPRTTSSDGTPPSSENQD